MAERDPLQADAFIVIPFVRDGSLVGPGEASLFEHAKQAEAFANGLLSTASGVAILVRRTDPETDRVEDVMLASVGAVPPGFPTTADWTMRLH